MGKVDIFVPAEKHMFSRYGWVLWLTAFCLLGLLAPSCSSADDFPRSLVDDEGSWVYLERRPERIVSLAPANTEMLFALGAGSRLVGVTTYCDYPLQATYITKVGDYTSPSNELIVSLCPDLVLAAYGNDKDSLERLSALGYTIAALHPKTLTGVLHDIELVARLTGQDPEGEVLLGQLKGRIDQIRERVLRREGPPPRVWYVVWYPELWSAGCGTFAHDLLQTIGVRNIAENVDGWKILSKETVILEDPEIILCSAMDTSPDFRRQSILEDSQLAGVSAVRTGRVYVVNQDLVERPGPRIVDGLEELFHLVYQQQ